MERCKSVTGSLWLLKYAHCRKCYDIRLGGCYQNHVKTVIIQYLQLCASDFYLFRCMSFSSHRYIINLKPLVNDAMANTQKVSSPVPCLGLRYKKYGQLS